MHAVLKPGVLSTLRALRIWLQLLGSPRESNQGGRTLPGSSLGVSFLGAGTKAREKGFIWCIILDYSPSPASSKW